MGQLEATTDTGDVTSLGRPWLMLGVVGLTLLAALGLSLFLPHDRYTRYQQLGDTLHFRSIWAYERIVYDPAPIDIAILGNSRLRAGVSAPGMQAALSNALGREVKVVNLSLPQEGRDAHYALAKVLFEHRPEVQLVILSAIEEMPRQSHPAFGNIADPLDALFAPTLINPSYGENLAFTSFRQLSLAAETALPGAFGIKGFDKAKYLGTDFDTTTSYMSATGNFVDKDTIYSAEELRGPARKRIASITKPVLPELFAANEYAVEYRYTNAIAQLAEDRGARVGFLYLPVFEHKAPLAQEAFYTKLGPVFSATCIADRHEMFSDYGHMNHRGALQVTDHFASALLSQRDLLGVSPSRAGRLERAPKVFTICP